MIMCVIILNCFQLFFVVVIFVFLYIENTFLLILFSFIFISFSLEMATGVWTPLTLPPIQPFYLPFLRVAHKTFIVIQPGPPGELSFTGTQYFSCASV